jgi:GntR family transcriptional repressor for pyruvate dehydrogenase complex
MMTRVATSSPPPRPSLTESVTRHLADRVLGELEPGNALPSESDLAAELGVSRLTVREAVRALHARGLVDTRRGRRPVVAYPTARPIGDFLAAAVRRDPRRLLDLLEVRQALEVDIARLAALRAGSGAGRAAVDAAQAALDAMRRATDPDQVHAADLRFHESLAAGTGNELLSFLMEAMEEPLRASRLQSLRGHLARGRTVADVIEQHARILDRIRAHDAAGAATAMREHLAQTGRDLRAAFATPEGGTDADRRG